MPHKMCEYNQGVEMGEDTRNALQSPRQASTEFSAPEEGPRNQTIMKFSTTRRSTCIPFEQ